MVSVGPNICEMFNISENDPTTEIGRPPQITEDVPGDIGRVAPQTKILATPLVRTVRMK